MVCYCDRDLREQPLGFAQVRVVRVICGILVEVPQRADCGAKCIERCRPFRQRREQLL